MWGFRQATCLYVSICSVLNVDLARKRISHLLSSFCSLDVAWYIIVPFSLLTCSVLVVDHVFFECYIIVNETATCCQCLWTRAFLQTSYNSSYCKTCTSSHGMFLLGFLFPTAPAGCCFDTLWMSAYRICRSLSRMLCHISGLFFSASTLLRVGFCLI